MRDLCPAAAGRKSYWNNGELTGLRLHDKAHRTITRMAYFDALTGLPNQLNLQERLKATLRGGGGAGDCSVALVLLDLDRFGEINLALGLRQGDALLKEVGRRLRNRAPGRRKA